MRKSTLVKATVALTALGAVVAVKSLVHVTSATGMQAKVNAPARLRMSVFPPDMMAIVPAPVIDTKAEAFVGTGDGSNGVWIKP